MVSARWTRVGEPIGKGGFGTVWRVCESSSSENEAALKVVDVPRLLHSGVDSAQLEKDLLREVNLMSRLSHIKGVTALLEAFIETSGVVHLVMELCRGPTLQWVLDGRGALSEPEAKGIMRQLLEAVSHLHAQLTMHRDLKPENVMFLSPLPDSWRDAGSLCGATVKILDLGLARPLLASWNNDSAHGGDAARALSRKASGAAPPFLCPTPEGSRHDGGLFSSAIETSPCSSPGDSHHGGRSMFFGSGPARRSKPRFDGVPSSPGGSAHSGNFFYSINEGSVRMNGAPPEVRKDCALHASASKLEPPARVGASESPGVTLQRRLQRLPSVVNVTPVGTRLYAAPELLSAAAPLVALPPSAALAADIFSLGRMLRYMLTGLPPGMSHQEYLQKQGILMPMLKAAVRLMRGRKAAARPRPRVVLSPAHLSPPAKALIALLTSAEHKDRPTASAARAHEWLERESPASESPQAQM